MQNHSSIRSIISRCSYPGFIFEFDPGQPDCAPRMRVRCPDGVCNETGKALPWNGRWWPLSYHMVDTEVVHTAFCAIQRALEHETREKFRFDGASVFNPHLNVHHLVALRRRADALDERIDTRQKEFA